MGLNEEVNKMTKKSKQKKAFDKGYARAMSSARKRLKPKKDKDKGE